MHTGTAHCRCHLERAPWPEDLLLGTSILAHVSWGEHQVEQAGWASPYWLVHLPGAAAHPSLRRPDQNGCGKAEKEPVVEHTGLP